MTSKEVLKADVLDILFENRNKSYGAYTLRKFYANRLMMALFFTIALVVTLLLLANRGTTTTPDINKVIDDVTTIVLPKTIPQVVPQMPPPVTQQSSTTKVEQVDYNKIVITQNPPEDVVLPTQNDISGAAISNHNIAGVPGDVTQPAVEPGNGKAIEKPAEEKNEFIASERAPEFPGGAQAWLNFLTRNLNTPEDLLAGEKRTVVVRFLVSGDGSITQFEMVQSGGNAFDNEVKRVLKKMPKWRPALQNGRAVAVTFTQPVTFIGEEE